MLKSAQNNSSNGGPNAAIEGTFHCGLNVAPDGTLGARFVSALDDPTDASFEGTQKDLIRDLYKDKKVHLR